MPTKRGAYSPDYAGSLGNEQNDLNWMPSDSSTGVPVRDKQPRRGIDVSWVDRDQGGFSGPLPRSRRK